MYILRLDDASEYMDNYKWDRMEKLLDKYSIKPIVGIIPNNKDESLVSKYEYNPNFWNKARVWQTKGWAIALHGYTHVYSSNQGGINPVNTRSEFAGLPLEEQRRKIENGIKIFNEQEINARIFFAPSHTFDENTLKALELESNIRIISDTVANDIYKIGEFYFIPQQSGKVRRLPFKVTTFCYHPNTMDEEDFKILEDFILKYQREFLSFDDLKFIDRKPSYYDKMLKELYFITRRIRKVFRG